MCSSMICVSVGVVQLGSWMTDKSRGYMLRNSYLHLGSVMHEADMKASECSTREVGWIGQINLLCQRGYR